MFENKSLKGKSESKKVDAVNRNLQRKAVSSGIIQKAISKSNNISAGEVAQLKKILANDSIMNLLDSKPLQREEIPEEEEEPVQMKQENNTGMPDQLKTGIENLSGIDMSDVKVHYNSDKPATVGALAYTQGNDIHVASGQEKHLAHEAWHVVQQAQGRVEPTTQFKDVSINDDPGLEHEADVMGEKAWGT